MDGCQGDRSLVAGLNPDVRAGWRTWDRFFVRVLGGLLLISLPMVIVMGALVFTLGTQSVSDAGKASTQVVAKSASTRISDWVAERAAELRQLARESVGQPDLSAMQGATASGLTFDAVEVVEPSGFVVASFGPSADIQSVGTAP